MLDERRTQHATLGCGTFILFALIVLFFSRPGISDLEENVRSLRSEVGDLKKSVETQTNEIKRLEDKLKEKQPGLAADGQGKD
jgi:type II secretory pathway component PulM